MAGHTHGSGGYGRELVIVVLLVFVLIVLHSVAVPAGDIDPTAMLALGFVVLASYAIGHLVEIVKLPHITGYLLAGLFFGASAAHFLAGQLPFALPPPLDHGILNEEVVAQLSVLDTLAVALIAMTAGGELEIASLRRGLKAITGVLTGQMLLITGIITTFVVLVSGMIPSIALPGLGGVSTGAALALGLVVAAISVATSPAATIAVINDTRARGLMTSTVLSTVVLKDVVVVVAFSVASVFASQSLGLAAEGDLGTFLAQHILGSLVAGAVLGFLFALYLRYVGREVLLMIVGVVYTATLLASELHLDPVLLFIAAGFTVRNNPVFEEGDRFIHSVEQLSMPVYVVFFTLAGAKLHLDDLVALFPWALALVLLRMFALWVGVGAGARIARADEGTRKHGWLGFISQAGVAISLSAIVGQNLGQPGAALSVLVISGVALNEIIGPIALKMAIGFAGEAGKADEPEPADEPTPEEDRRATPAAAEHQPLPAWPEPTSRDAPWGRPPPSSSEELTELVAGLREELRGIANDVAGGPLARLRAEAEAYVFDLRRDFLRHHRRLVVAARADEAGEKFFERLFAEEARLADHFRDAVVGRGGRLSRRWSPARLVGALDRIVARQPVELEAPWEPESFLSKDGDGLMRGAARRLLRLRRRMAGWFKQEIAPRRVPFRDLVRYHLAGAAPVRLEELAVLLVDADLHLAERTRSLFDGIVRAYDDLDRSSDTLADDLLAMRRQVDEELSLAVVEVDRIVREGELRTTSILAGGLRRIAEEIGVFGTLDLPARRRRSSRIWFDTRIRALDMLQNRLEQLRGSVSAVYSRLGLELEIAGLTARLENVLHEHVSVLVKDAEGRGHRQAERLETALSEALDHVEDELESEEHSGETLAATLRQLSEPLEKVAQEALQGALEMREQLASEATVTPLLDAIRAATTNLGERYDAPAGRLARDSRRLPDPVPVVEIPFRSLATASVEADLGPKLVGASADLAGLVDPYVASLQELERALAFNVELASAELDLVHENAVPEATMKLLQEIVLGGFERHRELVRGHVEVTQAWAPELGSAMRGAIIDGLDGLQRELIEGDLSQARIDAFRRRVVGQQIRRGAEQLPSLMEISGRILRRTVQGLIGEDRIEGWWRVLGLPAPAAARPTADALSPPPAGEHLPLVYRRLFASGTLEAAEVLAGREGDIERARAALRRKRGLRAVALVGLDGAGKSALARRILRGNPIKTVRRIELSAPANAADVDAWFDSGQEGQLVVVDGFHWLVSIRADGFAALRRFVEGVVADDGRNAWLLHCDRLVWDCACSSAPLAHAFREVVRVEPLDQEALETALLARHNLSGMSLSFEPQDSGSRLERLFAQVAGQIRRPYESFFSSLHAASGGLVRDALRMWIAAVDEVDEKADYVHVSAIPPSPQSAVRRLPEDVLLNLYQIARQGWMDADVQAHLYRVDTTTAEAQLGRLSHMGLLERRNDAYRIRPHLRGPVYRVLSERGWV